MRTYNSFNDILRFIGDQPLCCASLYADDYAIPVSHAYLNLLRSKGFVYGEDIPEISEDEFWECFKCGEKDQSKNKLACDLNEQEQQLFAEAFYSLCPFDDRETNSPFGCPWFWCASYELEGDTIEEMATNFFISHKDWIEDLQKENEELENIED